MLFFPAGRFIYLIAAHPANTFSELTLRLFGVVPPQNGGLPPLSMVREVVFGVGFALLLPRFFGLDGVLYSMPMSDILTFLIAGYLICKTYRELSTKGEV